MKKIKAESRKAENKASNKTNYLNAQPFASHFFLNLQSLNVIKHFLKGTETPEWLVLAENKTYKRLKLGNYGS